jgi:hypothetical protein
MFSPFSTFQKIVDIRRSDWQSTGMLSLETTKGTCFEVVEGVDEFSDLVLRSCYGGSDIFSGSQMIIVENIRKCGCKNSLAYRGEMWDNPPCRSCGRERRERAMVL